MSARKLYRVVAVAFVVLGIAVTPSARAVYVINNGGSILVGRGTVKPSPDCPTPAQLDGRKNESLSQFEQQCVNGYRLIYSLWDDEGNGTPPIQIGQRALARLSASSSPALALGISTPYVPYLGNPLVVLGGVYNSPVPADATAGYSVGLRRNPDCSLAEDLFGDPAASTPSAVGITTLSGAQDYFHQLAGLTTQADVFAGGCAYSFLGRPTSNNILLLGTTSTGSSYSAEASSGLIVTVENPTSNTFTNMTLLSSSALQGGIAVADLNGDGNLDIVAGNVTNPGTGQLSTAVFLGHGDGSFGTPTYYPVGGDLTIDDVTGDGIPDIVVVNATGVTTLVGKVDGTFTVGPTSALTVSTVGVAGSVLTGDFNGDGKKDLIAGGVVLLGAGNGSFTLGSAVTSDAAVSFGPGGIANFAVGDFNGDGKLDLAVSESGFVAIFLGNGTGTFSAGPRYAALPDIMQVSVTDIDGDGHPDIVLGTGAGGIYQPGGYDTPYTLMQILMGEGGGQFATSASYAVYPAPSSRFGNVGYGAQIATGDFNGDGKADALVLDHEVSPATLKFLPGNGTGALGAGVASATGISPNMIVAADMNGDGKPDAVLAGNGNSGPGLAVLLNQGNGSFASETDYPLPDNPVSLAVADFNGDGLPDVAVGVAPSPGGSGASGVYVLFGQANGTLAAPVKVDASVYPTGLAAGDLNGDGRADLVVADQGAYNYVGSSQQINGAVHVYLGNTNKSFTSVTAPTTSATNYTVAALGDLNGDGKLDLVLAGVVAGTSAGSGTPNLYTFAGKGDGTFQAVATAPLLGSDGNGAQSIVLADFNADGHLDIGVGNPLDYTELFLGQGDGNVAQTAMALAQRPLSLAAVDLNGDGRPELLVGSAGEIGGSMAVFMNTGTWAAATSATAATTTTLAAAPNPAASGESVTLTATVTGTGGTPTGTVTFLDGSSTLGTAALSASGIATYSTSSLTAGTHSLAAAYSGSSTFSASTSVAVSLTVSSPVPDFTMTASPTSGSVSNGGSVNTTITLTPSGGFSGTVSLACSGLPAGASCSFSPSSVAPNGGKAAVSTLTFKTSAASASAERQSRPFDPSAPTLPLLALALPAIVRRRLERRATLRVAAVGLGLVGVLALHGCGGSDSSSSHGIPAGTYTVTITATSGSITHSVGYALTVN